MDSYTGSLSSKLSNSKWLIDPLNGVQQSFATTRVKVMHCDFTVSTIASALFSMLISVAHKIYCEDGGHQKKNHRLMKLK